MTPIPQISKAARNALMKWGLANMPEDLYAVFCKELAWFALSPSDDLDAVRARFQSKTREGCTPKLFAKAYGYLYGIIYGNSGACSAQWFEDTGASIDGKSENDLLPISPHSALIARLNEAYITGIHDPDLYKCAADALEAIEVQK